jgi:hypothetical protein
MERVNVGLQSTLVILEEYYGTWGITETVTETAHVCRLCDGTLVCGAADTIC